MTRSGPGFLLHLGWLAAALAAAAPAQARTRYVAMNGVDPAPNGSLTACSAAAPCRTLNHAIESSQPGDTIQVGPGLYAAPAEQPPALCACLIAVGKPLQIVSRDGAYSTVIDVAGADQDGVRIDAADVVFGTRKHGFTITGSVLARSAIFATGARLRLGGNVAFGNGGFGYFLQGSDQVVTGNVAIGNETGFLLDGERCAVSGNLALGNSTLGFDVAGADVAATGNVASANGEDGFHLRGMRDVLTRNVSVGNATGVETSAGIDHVIDKSSVIGNGTGIVFGAPTAASRLNVYGSGDYCGGFNTLPDELPVPGSFWGAASGPGPVLVGPADSDDCGLQSIDAEPFATKEIKVVPKTVNKFLP